MKNKGGRPSTYNPEVVEAICERLSAGEPMAAICREDGMPAYRTVKDWADEKDEAGRPTERGARVSAAIARAREAGEETLLAECLQIADDGRNDKTVDDDGHETVNYDHIQRSKLRIETRLKLLAKWNPKKWGERTTLAGDPEAPLAFQRIEMVVVDPGKSGKG